MLKSPQDRGTTMNRSANLQHHRRGLSLSDDCHLDLFSRSRRSFSIPSTEDPQAKNGLDDLLSSTDGGKHDYDWLLTPPGTPLFPSSDGIESKPASGALKHSSLSISMSTNKASRLSVSQSESNSHARPARISSVTRSSISTSQYSSYSNKSGSILNTSSASVSSYIRSSTPNTRSSSTGRPSTLSARPTLSRSSTPAKSRPTQNTSADQTKPSQSSRPSTPNSRTQNMRSVNSPASRSTSRPSTPTRRNPGPSLTIASGPSISAGRGVPNVRNAATTSRPSSPSPRVLSYPQPAVIPDFPLETPPNLRTTLPDRPLSAGRSRPGGVVTAKGNAENPGAAVLARRQSSPIVTRGRLQEPSTRGRIPYNGQVSSTTDFQRTAHTSDSSSRKPVKTSTQGSGFGRSISKKSIDMAIRHMDIKNSSNGVRPTSGSTLFPQSIRSGNNKSQVTPHGDLPIYHPVATTENGNHVSRCCDEEKEEKSGISAKLAEVDIYESSRYDTFLLKEDLKNGSWLHCLDDKSDQEAIFDNGLETLPEPFDPL